MDLGLKGKRVLITGGSKGIGRAIAEGFTAKGARVAIYARNAEETARLQLVHLKAWVCMRLDVS